MNMLEVYVSNITSDIPDEDGKGHTIICDTNCWGSRRYGVEKHLCADEYKSVMENGYYMG